MAGGPGTSDSFKRKKHIRRLIKTKMFFANWSYFRDHLKERLPGAYLHLEVIYKEDFSCDFADHQPPKKDLLIEDLLKIRDSRIKGLSMERFEKLLMSSTQDGKLINDPFKKDKTASFQGFLVCEGGTLCEESRAPSIGFCIQKTQTAHMLSRFTENLLRHYNITTPADGKKIVGGHSYNSVHVIHTAVYQWLTLTFGWQHKPLILHALLWKSKIYEGPTVDYFLRERRAVIKRMETCLPDDKNPLAIRKATIKLLLCSSYGYCSLNSGSGGSRYKKSAILNLAQLQNVEYKTRKRVRLGLPIQVRSAVTIAPNSYKVYSPLSPQAAPLLSHGATILALSKVIFLKSVYFLLSHLSPDRSQIIYIDTDSIHLTLHKETLLDNVPTHLRASYIENRDEFFDENRAPSGQLIVESIVDYEKVFSEKVYILKVLADNELTATPLLKSRASKGIPYNIEIDKGMNPFFGFQQSMMRRQGKSKGVGITVFNKQLGGLLVPRRRYFIAESFSLPFLFPHKNPDQALLYNVAPLPSLNYKKLDTNEAKGNPLNIDRSLLHDTSKMSGSLSPPKKSATLQALGSKVPDTRDIVDKAYQLKRKPGDYELIYCPPKSLKKSSFIEYEAAES